MGDIPKRADDIISVFGPFETVPSDEDNLIENEMVRIVTEKIKQILHVKRGGVSQGQVEQLRKLSKELFTLKYSQKKGKMFLDVMKIAKEALSHAELLPRLEVKEGHEVLRETISASEESEESSSYESVISEETSFIGPKEMSTVEEEIVRIEESFNGPTSFDSIESVSSMKKRISENDLETFQGCDMFATRSPESIRAAATSDSVEIDAMTFEQILEKYVQGKKIT